MAISSQRFKFLDRETDVGTVDLLGMADNAVYTAVTDSADSVASFIQEGDDLLGTMAESISDLTEKVKNASADVLRKVKEALNGAIDKILNMKLPNFATKLLDGLKSLDLGGVKGFFTDLLKVGAAFLCNNLDFLKSFMLGYSLTENILSGLLIGLVLTWLDRFCKGFSKDEVLAANNKGKLGMLFGSDGIVMNVQSALGKFTNAYADLARYSNPYTPNIPYSRQEFLRSILNGNYKDAVANLRNAEIGYYERNNYISYIDTELSNYDVGSADYNYLLSARGDLLTTPLIAEARIEKANSYSNLNDALGSMALNLKGVDVSSIPTHSLSDIEKDLLVKLEDFKNTTMNNPDIQTRDHESGSFADFDFTTILPTPDQETLDYLMEKPGLEESHRYNGLHPTTEVFTEETMPHTSKPKDRHNQVAESDKISHGTTPIGVSDKSNNAPAPSGVGNAYDPNEHVVGSGNTKNDYTSNSGYSSNNSGSSNKGQSTVNQNTGQGQGLSGDGSVITSNPNRPTPVPKPVSIYPSPPPVIPGNCYA